MPTLRARRREPCQAGPLAVVAAAAIVLLLALHGTSGGTSLAAEQRAPVWRGLVGNRPAEVSVGERAIVVLKAPSLAARVAAAGGRASEADERRWNAEALQQQKRLLSRLSLQEGLSVNADFTYTRVINGFSAALSPAAVGALERTSAVAGIYPVRIGYPAAVSSHAGVMPAPYGSVGLPAFDGHGVTIALLDTGVDGAHAYLGGRVRRGFDVVGGGSSAAAQASPSDPSVLERHGTEMAGLLVGDGGPNGLHGVAPGASVLPIRVAGWQQDAHRSWVVYARTDQVIAGLERAVDPNGDGDAHDGARVTLLGVVEPWAAFADSPAAQAVRGALALDDLVVTPAGNDGPAGPSYGSISGPGGAPGTLTVGAADLRRRTKDVQVVLRSGLRVIFDARLPLAGSSVPSGRLTLPIGMARRAGGAAPSLERFFSRDGRSLVGGRAALVNGGSDPHQAVENAARAGAYAVLLYGESLPAGALGLDESVTVPVVGVPLRAAAKLAAAAAGDASVSVTIGGSGSHRNPAAGTVAGFSSRGLAFGGDLKPDVSGSGVALATAEPGVNPDGSPAFGTVNGSSAAAATVAGAAAVLTQARRGIDAPTLKALLVGAARFLPDVATTAQGAGLVDVGAAAASEVVAEPVSLAFTRPGETHALRVRNVSTRALVVTASAGAGVEVEPGVARLAKGGTATLTATAPVEAPPSARPLVSGSIAVAVRGGAAVRVPWVYALRPPPGDVLRSVVLRRTAPVPSTNAPAILEVQAGRVAGRAEVRGFTRLDLRLLNAHGDDMGLLARLRDGLPGRYDFGLTGRGPKGQTLRHGRYRLRLLAVPTGGGPPTARTIAFPIGPLNAHTTTP